MPPRQERAGRGDRGGRGGRGPRVSRPAAPAQERHSSDVQLKSNNAIQKSNDIPESLNTDDSFPVVNNRESLSVTAHLNVPQTTAASMNSVWGGGSSLAQKIKTAEKMKVVSSTVYIMLFMLFVFCLTVIFRSCLWLLIRTLNYLLKARPLMH